MGADSVEEGERESCNDSRVQRHSPTRKILKVEVFFMGFKAHLATSYPRFLASEYRFLLSVMTACRDVAG